MLFRQNDRHPRMDLPHQLIRFAGDDRRGMQPTLLSSDLSSPPRDRQIQTENCLPSRLNRESSHQALSFTRRIRAPESYSVVFEGLAERWRRIKASADITNAKMYVDLQQFCFHCLPVFSTRLALFQGNTVEKSGKGNPEIGFKSPPELGFPPLSGCFRITYVLRRECRFQPHFFADSLRLTVPCCAGREYISSVE
jgi:hypothetical protein